MAHFGTIEAELKALRDLNRRAAFYWGGADEGQALEELREAALLANEIAQGIESMRDSLGRGQFQQQVADRTPGEQIVHDLLQQERESE